MRRPRGSIHTVSQSATQALGKMVASHHARVVRLLRQVMAGKEYADTIHAIRTYCRRLQALLELCGRVEQARAVADCVGGLSKLRALQVFRQYLIRCDARQKDLALVGDRLTKQKKKLNRAETYRQIELVVSKQARAAICSPLHAWSRRLADLRHEHECLLTQLIADASDKPRRKRLHALRLALKTIRYQTEWLPGRAAAKCDMLSQLKRAQAVLGRYEELADFHRWGKKLSRSAQTRIHKDWQRARKRARHVPARLQWLLDALASGQVWTAEGLDPSSMHRTSTGVV
ncbi:MAG: CHAD domain-containing protein [Nitrospira sp.]|nr:MAG: CHAD domain-containing protein [Nitrospira sp.]